MRELKLRGYVTPDDCGGSVQKALELAARLDINKVVLTGAYTESEPLMLTSGMYLVLENCRLNAQLVTPRVENHSFRQKFITIEGRNAHLSGGIHIFNAHHVNISGLDMDGDLVCEYTLWGNLNDLRFASGSLKLGRGCGNFIVQRLDSKTPAYIDGSISCGKVVPGVKPDLNSIVLCDSVFDTDMPAVQLGAADDCGVLNIQADHIKAPKTAVQVGHGQDQPEHLFFNLTFTDLDAPEAVVYRNQAKHVYQK